MRTERKLDKRLHIIYNRGKKREENQSYDQAQGHSASSNCLHVNKDFTGNARRDVTDKITLICA